MLKHLIFPVSVLILILSCAHEYQTKVLSDPAGANVTASGNYIGKTPVVVVWNLGPLSQDIAILEVSMPGYVQQVRMINPRRSATVMFVLEPVSADKTAVAPPSQRQKQQMQRQMMGPTIVIGGRTATEDEAATIVEYGSVSFQSNPTGAEIYVEDNFIGSTPTSRLRFEAGTYNITLKLRGHKDWTRKLLVISNSEFIIKAELEKD